MLRRGTFPLLLIISLGHVLVISAQVQSKSGIPLIEAAAFGVFSRFQQTTTGVTDGVRSGWTKYFALRGVERDNEQLRKRVIELEAQLQMEQAQAAKARSLEEALNLQRTLDAPTLAARVIAGNPQPGTLEVTIDRGSADGVEPNMAVVGSRGIIGRVIGPLAPHAARVQLIVGKGAAAGATLEKSGVGGVVMGGEKDPPLRLDYIPNLVEVQPGERVLTSGQDDIYPSGFVIGVVEKSEKGNDGQRQITVRPSVDVSHLEVVLVILRPAQSPAQKSGSRPS
ncbi:MAG TPA: rod shape-determining protein MreC [Vicinamibacterales bacterium]|nr:rod shape-determining protein MreC [Vicinamibacterales bacterium]